MPRRSSVERLDAPLKEIVDRLLREGRHTLDDIVAHLEGLTGERPVSRSALGRYSQRMEEIGARIRRRREIEEQWIGRLGEAPRGKAGRLLIEVVRQLAWDSVTNLSDLAEGEGESTVDPNLLRALSTTVWQLQRAERAELDYERALAQQIDDAERAVEGAMKRQGISGSTADAIREALRSV